MLLERRTAILIAIFPVLALGLLNDLYLRAAYAFGLEWFYLIDFLQWVVTPLCVWTFVLKPWGIAVKDFGFAFRVPGKRPLAFAGELGFAAVLLWISYELVRSIAYRFLWRYAESIGFQDAIPQSFPWNAMVILYFASSAALIEEGVFRGLFWAYFSSLSPRYCPKFWYVAVTSLLFASAHSEQGPHGVIAAFSFGIAASLLYLQLRNLWPLIFGHFIIDVMAFWPPSG